MGWDDLKVDVKKQTELFLELSVDQKLVFEIIKKNKEISVDKIVTTSALSASKVASALLMLEFEGLIQSLPGKLYKSYY